MNNQFRFFDHCFFSRVMVQYCFQVKMTKTAINPSLPFLDRPWSLIRFQEFCCLFFFSVFLFIDHIFLFKLYVLYRYRCSAGFAARLGIALFLGILIAAWRLRLHACCARRNMFDFQHLNINFFCYKSAFTLLRVYVQNPQQEKNILLRDTVISIR